MHRKSGRILFSWLNYVVHQFQFEASWVTEKNMSRCLSVATKAMHHAVMILWLSLVISRVQTNGVPGTSRSSERGVEKWELRCLVEWVLWGGFLGLDAWGACFHLNGRNAVKDENRKYRHLSSLLRYSDVQSRSFRGLAVFQEYCAVLGATLLLIIVMLCYV